MLRTLQNGDILIQLNLIAEIGFQKISKEKFISNLTEVAGHGMIYNEKSVYHSYAGILFSGVRSHPLARVIEPKESKLGSCIVIRCKDDKLQNLLIESAKRWDVPPEKWQALKQQRRQNSSAESVDLPTPFAAFRDLDHSKEYSKRELFRAFRSYDRNIKKLPVSKKKGISCSMFLSYSLKSAIINYMFPDKLPESILKKLMEIESLKTQGVEVKESKDKKSDTKDVKDVKEEKITKLHQIKTEKFLEFAKIVEEEITASKMNDDMKKLFFKFLQESVKGRDINFFCSHLLKYPQLFDFVGFLCFKPDDTSIIIDYDTFNKLKSGKDEDANMYLTEEDLIKIPKQEVKQELKR